MKNTSTAYPAGKNGVKEANTIEKNWNGRKKRIDSAIHKNEVVNQSSQKSELPRVSVFGLGYVGCVSSACLAEKGIEVWGVDVDPFKIDRINAGESPIFEPGLSEIIREKSDSGKIRATSDTLKAIMETDLSIICVGTPSREDGSLDLQYIHQVCDKISRVLQIIERKHILILRSTMLPGSTNMLVDKYFSDLIETGQLEIYYCPEFLREGTAIDDFINPSLEVMGTIDGEKPTTPEVASLISDNPIFLPWQSAEMVKYACNYFHAVKVAFANEIGRIGQGSDIDAMQVMNVLCQDTKLNISSYYMRPGNPFGGSCLPKDVKALKAFARSKSIAAPILENTLGSNIDHENHLFNTVILANKKSVTILGLAFKMDTDDLRESSMVTLAQRLLGMGYDVKIFDPQMAGAGKRELEESYPHLARLHVESLGEAVAEEGVVVAFRKCADSDELKKYLKESHTVIDINGWRELEDAPSTYRGLCW